MKRAYFLVVLLPLIGGAQPLKTKTVWDGIYSQAEAERGAAAYTQHCSRCHGDDLRRQGGVLIGSKFQERWREDNVHNFFARVRDTMPPGQAGRLSERDYLDIVAYVLSMNEYPAGSGKLAADELKDIMIISKDGPGAVPDFALVTVVGCLTRDGAKGWMVTNASEPVRTRQPRESTQQEFAAAMSRSGGTHTFHFLDTLEFADEFKAGRWVEAKGFLMRSPGNDRINPTWLKGLRESCAN